MAQAQLVIEAMAWRRQNILKRTIKQIVIEKSATKDFVKAIFTGCCRYTVQMNTDTDSDESCPSLRASARRRTTS